MIARLLADLVLVLHLAFIVFVVLGGLLVWRWWKLAWAHIPAVLWAILVEWVALFCPLTDLENWLRIQSGAAGYKTSFIEYYLLSIIYPTGLTRTSQIVLGTFVLLINLLFYTLAYRRWHSHRK